MSQDKKLAIAAVIVGLILGYTVRAFTETERFIIKDAPGIVGGAYKVDTRTGKTWFLLYNKEHLVQ
jgi:hypothetical protein